jgi:hypothetical protein
MKSVFKPVREVDALWDVGGRYINREEMVEYNKDPILSWPSGWVSITRSNSTTIVPTTTAAAPQPRRANRAAGF